MAETAWEQIKGAAKKGDLDDILKAVQKYFKLTPDTTYSCEEEPLYLRTRKGVKCNVYQYGASRQACY